MTDLAKDMYGVTTVLNILDKPGLKIAAARLAVTEALALLAKNEPVPPDGWKLVDAIWGGKADRGTDGHELAETVGIQFAHGIEATDAFVADLLSKQERLSGDDLYLGTLAVRNWFERSGAKVMAYEFPVACLHCGYAATADLELQIGDDHYPCCDIKWGGLYDTHALQVTAQIHAMENTVRDWKIARRDYRGAHRYTVTSSNGAERPPHVVRQQGKGALLWVSPSADQGCELVPVRTDMDQLRAFFAVHDAWKWRRENGWRR